MAERARDQEHTPITVSERVPTERGLESGRRQEQRSRAMGSVLQLARHPLGHGSVGLDVQPAVLAAAPALWGTRCEVLNLSLGGVAFESRWQMAVGTRVRLALMLPGLTTPLALTAQARWCRRNLDRGQYTIGVRFDAFGPAAEQNPEAALELLRSALAREPRE